MKGPIAIIAHAHPSVSKGGAELAAYTLFQGLKRLGLPAIFIAAVAEADQRKLCLDGPDEHVIFHDPAGFSPHFLQGALGPMRALVRLLQSQQAVAVNFHHYLGFGAGVFRYVKSALQLPMFLTLHEYLAICAHHGQMVTRPDKTLCQKASNQACAACFPEYGEAGLASRRAVFHHAFQALDGFIAPSRFLQSRYIDWGLPGAKIHLIENGLLHDAVPRPAAAAPPRSGPLVFGYFGQINPFKGVDLLLDAVDLLARTPDLTGRYQLRLHGNVIGLPEAFHARLNAATAQGSAVSTHGPYAQSEVIALMAACDAVIVPSRWWENSPLVVQEAFAANRPLIVAALGGLAEKVMPDQSGVQFRPNDAQDLARVLARLIQSGLPDFPALPRPVRAEDMAQSYLALFAHFSPRLAAAGRL